MKIAFLFPGQGAQSIGMGKDLYEKYEEIREVYKKASEISGIDMATLCFNGIKKKYEKQDYKDSGETGEDLDKTENTQLAIATMSLSILKILEKENIKAEIATGLSLGEYTALIYGNFLSFEDGIKLLKKRGYLMQHELPYGDYLMVAVIGLESSKIEEICENMRQKGEFIAPANYNYSNQTVVSGYKDAVKNAMDILKTSGAKRVVELKTSGPFHTNLLEKAKNEYAKVLKKVEFKSGKVKVIKNMDGTLYKENENMKEILANHIVSPVRFDKAIKYMVENEIDTFIEVGPRKSFNRIYKKRNKRCENNKYI